MYTDSIESMAYYADDGDCNRCLFFQRLEHDAETYTPLHYFVGKASVWTEGQWKWLEANIKRGRSDVRVTLADGEGTVWNGYAPVSAVGIWSSAYREVGLCAAYRLVQLASHFANVATLSFFWDGISTGNMPSYLKFLAEFEERRKEFDEFIQKEADEKWFPEARARLEKRERL